MHITKLCKVLAQWEENGGDLANELYELGNYPIEKHKDAKAICRTLANPRLSEPKGKDIITSPLHAIVGLFQNIKSREGFEELCTNGLPHLRRFLEQGLEHASHDNDDLLFILKILAMYGQKEDVDLIIKAARKPLMQEGYLWSVILGQVDHEHVGHKSLCDGLREPLPDGFIAMTYLDFANSLAINGHLDKHPFDSDQGYARLEHWLSDPDEKHYALSATTALPFIQEHKRQRLLQIAAEHPDVAVQMEAAWAMAKTGLSEGRRYLSNWCLEANYSQKACLYLEELGIDIPAKCQEPDFQAMAEMCNWLAHPNECGYPPDKIELYEKRFLYWPPTEDKRPVWLFKYTYNSSGDKNEPDIGIAMIGSVTFALFGEATQSLSPEDVYGLHCCWELEMNQDSRAPKKRTASAGREILCKYNEGFK